jgi:putative ABC transport system permease protein
MTAALSHAWRSWKSAPGVALLAILAFAVGIGSATAIFTVVNGVLLRPLPYPDSERFVFLYGASTTNSTMMAMSLLELQDYERQTTTFDAIGWFRAGRFHLTAPGEPRFVPGTAVTPALVRALGSPMLGQWFADDSSAVISSALWRRLGGGPEIIGSLITLDERPYTITGVMPPAFQLPVAALGSRGDTEVWIPLVVSPEQASNRNSRAFSAYARRKPRVSLEQADADAKRIAALVAATAPASYRNYTAGVVDLRDFTMLFRSGLRAPLLILLGGAGLLLLIACANVATLLLARSVARARETALRVALGASRRQLALRYFAEGALVSTAGAVAGVGLSALMVQQILIAASAFIPRVEDIAIDWTVLGFSVALAIATGVLAALAPLWQAIRTAPNAVLTDGVRASAAAPARRLAKAFVVAEIALAFTLLATSAILVVHLRNLDRVSLGFQPDGLVTFRLTLPRRPGLANVDAEKARLAEQARLMDALRQTPGVDGAAFASQLPAGGCGGSDFVLEDRPPDAPTSRACWSAITPDFFATMRIPLRQGRLLNESDVREDLIAAVINETAARTFWPERNPIGATARFGGAKGSRFEVVGVVGDVRNFGLRRPPEPEIYLPGESVLPVNPMNVVVRSNLPADQVIAALRRTIRQTNPTLVMEDVSTMHDVIAGTLQLERLSSLVMAFFGFAALLMATLGVYGVMSYFVRQRTVELGTRMALGAVNRDLVALVLGGGLKLSLAGVAVGSIALVGVVWLLVRYVDVANYGWLPFAASTAVVALVSAAAASVPAWRTTLISPMVAMRAQPPSVWQWARRRMARTVRDVRDAVAGGDDAALDVSPTGMLTAFVDAARGADSYAGALGAVLTSVCRELHVESAALLERHDSSTMQYRCLVAAGTLDTAAPVVAADGFLLTRLRAYPLPLPFAPNELPALAEWAAAHRPERLDEIRALAAAGIRLAVPLRTRTETLGVLLLGPPEGRDHFSVVEKEVLRACADQFALMIENAALTARVVEQEKLRRDLALAVEVQRRLLPAQPPSDPFVDLAADSIPARSIGGDYYDFIQMGEHRVGIALADVSGKGIAAALIMSVVQASLRIVTADGNVTAPQLAAKLNQFLYRSTPASKYATFFYTHVDSGHRQLRYVNAGHNPPYLFRHQSDAAGTAPIVEELSIGGTVVGMFPEAEYEEGLVELHAGDVLVVFTDGVPEAHNPAGEEFGEARLKEVVGAALGLSAADITAQISAALRSWIQDAEQYDDMTLVVMKVTQ